MFSREARLRMFKLIASLDWEAVPGTLFLTLTYPDDSAPNGYDIERQRAEFFRRVFREFGDVPVIWRVEWVARKSGKYTGEYLPHMHCLMLGAGFMQVWILKIMWKQIIGSDEDPQVNVKWLTDYKAVANYVAKYCGKVETEEDGGLLEIPTFSRIAGRHWGVLKRHLLPMAAEYRIVTTDLRVADSVHALARKCYNGVPTSPDRPYTVFSDHTEKIVKNAIALEKAIHDEYDLSNP